MNRRSIFFEIFSLREYQRLLCRFYGFYKPWEERASAIAPERVARRAKSGRLAADLSYLGVTADERPRIDLCNSLPPLDTLARVLGSMYVLEGATLGGQVLNRHMRSHFGLNSGGCDFFSGYGERAGAMCKQSGEILEEQPACAHDEIVTSAVATFESVRLWLGEDGAKAPRE